MRDAVTALVEELRAACSANTSAEVSRSASIDIEPHGPRELSLAVAPLEGTDRRWFLEVSIRRPKAHNRKWLMAGSREKVIEHLSATVVIDEVIEAAHSLADGDFHTDGLPEHW